MAARKPVKPIERSPLMGKHVRITFGQHYLKTGKVLETFERDAVRRQETAMVKLNDGRIVSGVPVKDLQVCA